MNYLMPLIGSNQGSLCLVLRTSVTERLSEPAELFTHHEKYRRKQ